LPRSQTSEKHSTSPNGLRNDADSPAGANLARNSIPAKQARRKLICSRCSKLSRTRPCHGEPGKSCTYCTRQKTRCSFLDPRPFRCEYCNRDYATAAVLRGHITSSHSREISCSVGPDISEVQYITDSPPSNIKQIPTSSLQQFEKSRTSANRFLNTSGGTTTRLSEQGGSQRRGYFNLEVVINEDGHLWLISKQIARGHSTVIETSHDPAAVVPVGFAA